MSHKVEYFQTDGGVVGGMIKLYNNYSVDTLASFGTEKSKICCPSPFMKF